MPRAQPVWVGLCLALGALSGVSAVTPSQSVATVAEQAEPKVSAPDKAATDRVLLVCEAAYLPARSVWQRTVEIGYDQKRVRSVAIDGVAVYAFSVRGTAILTSMDNERIQVDTATQTWTSDFRGLATSQGHCERAA